MNWVERLGVAYAVFALTVVVGLFLMVLGILHYGPLAIVGLLFLMGVGLQRMGWWFVISLSMSVVLLGVVLLLNIGGGSSEGVYLLVIYFASPLIGAVMASGVSRWRVARFGLGRSQGEDRRKP